MWKAEESKIDRRKTINDTKSNRENIYGNLFVTRKKDNGFRYPKSILKKERPATYTGCISFGNTQHMTQLIRSDSTATRRSSCRSVR